MAKTKWTRDNKVALAGVILFGLAAIIAVPIIQRRLHLDIPPPEAPKAPKKPEVIYKEWPSGMKPIEPPSCPVTKSPPNPFVPPQPYPSQLGPEGFWFGSEKLWIQLPTDGTWKHLPHYNPTDTAFRQKVQWWRQGYDWRTEHEPQLTITGRRLDSAAAPLATDEHANAADPMSGHPSIMTGIFIPTVGCWQITGDYKGDKLTFVIWVEQ
jgi:hypothetical protein